MLHCITIISNHERNSTRLTFVFMVFIFSDIIAKPPLVMLAPLTFKLWILSRQPARCLQPSEPMLFLLTSRYFICKHWEVRKHKVICIGVGAGKFLGVRRIFARSSQTCSKSFYETFTYKFSPPQNQEDHFWYDF